MGADKQAPIQGNYRPGDDDHLGEPYRVRKHKPQLVLTEVQKINLGGNGAKGKGMATAGHRAKMMRTYDAKAQAKPERKKGKTPARSLADQFAAVGMGKVDRETRLNSNV